MDFTQWMLAKEAAEYAKMHPDTIRKLFRRGEIRTVRVGSTWRTKPEWVDEYLMRGAA